MWWYILLLSISSVYAETCIAGTYNDSTVCKQCPNGYYQTEVNQTDCDPCSKGTFSDTTGSISCKDCPHGWSQDQVSSSECTLCPSGLFTYSYKTEVCIGCFPGTYSLGNGLNDCVDCPIGYFSEEPNQLSCSKCPAGKFQDIEGQKYCQECLPGKYSVVASSTCIDCLPGRYISSISSKNCLNCQIGRYQPEKGSERCLLCEKGKFNDIDGQTSCKPCSTASNCTSCDGFGLNQSVCTECPLGQFSKDSEICEMCPYGLISSTMTFFSSPFIENTLEFRTTGSNVCSECLIGDYFYEEGHDCKTCPIGTSVENYTCQDCPLGRYRDSPIDPSVEEDVCKVCPSGYFGQSSTKCAACASGTYQIKEFEDVNNTVPILKTSCSLCTAPDRSMPGASECTQTACTMGDVGTTECVFCPAGYEEKAGACVSCELDYIKADIAGSCVQCDAGKISNANKTICESCGDGKYELNGVCTDCAAGTYMPVFDNTNPLVLCEECSPGQYQDQTGKQTCKECSAGQYSEQYSSSGCDDCPIGWISKNVSSSGCEQCTDNTGQPNVGQTECLPCDLQLQQVSVNGICQQCPAGFEFNSLDLKCQECPEGKVSPSTNTACQECPVNKASQGSRTLCTSCAAGKVTNVFGIGSSFCIECDSTSSEACQECPPGTFFDSSILTCSQCAAGTIAEFSGAAACSECDVGFYSNTGRTQCQKCDSGEFSTALGCSSCAAGKYAQSGVCYDCPQGYYSENPKSSECDKCVEGSTNNILGSSNIADCYTCSAEQVVVDGICVDCNAGKYKSGQECANCPAGKYRLDEQENCENCAVGKTSKPGEICKNCQSGKYSDVEGAPECLECVSITSSGSCAECSAGRFGLPTTSCKLCPAGYWSVAGEENCAPCDIGRAQPLEGSTQCEDCLPGKFSNVLGAPECINCARGTFLETPKGGQCYNCPLGKYTSLEGLEECTKCPSGTYTNATGSSDISECLNCPAGYMEQSGICEICPERFFQSDEASTECISCPTDRILSPRGSTSQLSCFSDKGMVSYVFGMKGDSKLSQNFSKECEIRPNLVMLCPGCSCDDDSRNGFWAGPRCDECRRGFATSTCTVKCAAYDGQHDSTMCNGNGFCWYGKFGNGLCYCGGKSEIDYSGENVVVDVRLCPKGKICPGYGLVEQTQTTYKPLYYIIRYRQYSAFVLQLSKYTPNRGHMWFKRFTPSAAYENTCLSCVGPYEKDSQTVVGFWNNDGDYEDFSDTLQTKNGFNGENCQYECGLCLNGGRCNNVPHPYRYSYNIHDSFRGERPIFIPTTTCICSSLVYDAENMCCPNGFQPYIHYGFRLNPQPYSRYNRVPYITSITNKYKDYWIDRDIWLDVVKYPQYRTPYSEPEDGLIFVANNNKLWSEENNDYVKVDYRLAGPYNKHLFHGVPRDICRACPGLFGKGVKTTTVNINTEEKAEEIWWDNAMGAASRKCNGIGVCDFYARPMEPKVNFMGNAAEYTIFERGRLCSQNTIGDVFYNEQTRDACINRGIAEKAEFVAFSEPYKGGKDIDMRRDDNGTLITYITEFQAISQMMNSIGYASFLNDTDTLWSIIESTTIMPIPDSDSKFTIYSNSRDKCGLFTACEQFISVPRFNIYKLELGRGDDRLSTATFDRFDTCFTYTKDSNIQTMGLYVTQDYEQGQDPFLGGLCPKGHYCTQYNKIGYKEACPPGYFQPYQGITRTVTKNRCSIVTEDTEGCQTNEGTLDITDYTDNVCVRCPRNYWAPEGSDRCFECPDGSVKKISGSPRNINGRIFEHDDIMLNFPTSFTAGYNPWYYMPNELGRQDTDCAVMPPGIIHLPAINNKMVYHRPNFLPVFACPFGFSSRPATFIYEGFEDLSRLVTSSADSVIEAPYIEFKNTNKVEITNYGETCEQLGFRRLTFGKCTETLQSFGVSSIRIHANGVKGCYIHKSRPDVGVYSISGVEKCVPTIKYFCQSGVDNRKLITEFVRKNCFRCPGNSMTGPSSTTCTTCFANQMKVFAKEAIQKISEGNELDMNGHQTEYKKIFDGECSGAETIKYQGTSDNPGTNPEERVEECAKICDRDNNEGNFKGFVVVPTSGRCYCEPPDSATCTRAENDYDRYDFVQNPVGIKLGAPSSEIDTRVPYNTEILNYDLPLYDEQGYFADYVFEAVKTGGDSTTGGTEDVELVLADCYLVCSHIDKSYGVQYGGVGAVGISKDRKKCACSYTKNPIECPSSGTCPGHQTFVWFKTVGRSPTILYKPATFDGECAGSQTQMYDSNNNPGTTDKERIEECAEACKFSYKNSDTKGFSVVAASGECYCEPQDSASCDVISNVFQRYDFYDGIEYPPWGTSALPLCAACQPGKFTNVGCKNCPAGFYTETPRDAQGYMCKDCEKGRYNDMESSTGCNDCAVGKYTSLLAQTECVNCPSGWFQNKMGQGECTECPQGYYSTSTGQAVCKPCSTGKYQSSTKSTSCIDCASGYYSDVKSLPTCKACPIGYKGIIKTSCNKCAAGKYQSNTAQSSCISCAPGQYSSTLGRTIPCVNCPSGQYAKNSGSAGCTWCSGGSLCSRAGGQGTACADGYFIPEKVHASYCKSCPREKSSSGAHRSCGWCAVGKTTNGKQSSPCKSCPSKGWSGASSRHYRGGNPNSYSSGSVSTSTPYHYCPWGGVGWGCNGKGGRRVVTAWITAPSTSTYSFSLGHVDDWANIKFRFSNGKSAGSWSYKYKQKATFTWPMSRGQVGSITFTCDNYRGAYSCIFNIDSRLSVHSSNPVSSYCGFPNIIKRL